MTKDRYWRVLAAVAVAAAFAYGCGGPDTVEDTVDHGGSLVSEEGQIAFHPLHQIRTARRLA